MQKINFIAGSFYCFLFLFSEKLISKLHGFAVFDKFFR